MELWIFKSSLFHSQISDKSRTYYWKTFFQHRQYLGLWEYLISAPSYQWWEHLCIAVHASINHIKIDRVIISVFLNICSLYISEFHLSLYVVNKGISDVSSFCNGSIGWLTFRPRVMYFKLSVSKDPPLLIRLFRNLLPKGFCVMLAWLCEDKKSNIRTKLRFYLRFISIADKYELMKNIEEMYFEIEAYDLLIFSLFSIYTNYQF